MLLTKPTKFTKVSQVFAAIEELLSMTSGHTHPEDAGHSVTVCRRIEAHTESLLGWRTACRGLCSMIDDLENHDTISEDLAAQCRNWQADVFPSGDRSAWTIGGYWWGHDERDGRVIAAGLIARIAKEAGQ